FPNIRFMFDDIMHKEAIEEVEKEIKARLVDDQPEPTEKSEALRKLEKEWDDKEKQYQKDLESHKKLLEKVENAKDLFTDANQIALDALARLDLRTYDVYLNELQNAFTNLFNSLELSDETRVWSPDKEIPEHAIRLLVDLF